MGSFVFKWPHPEATEVYVTGTFDDWGKTVKLDKVGDTWEKEVELPSAEKKFLYKFVVNGEWVTDHTAPKEDDGHSNVNNVLVPDHITKKQAAPDPGAALMSSAAPGSTTADLAGKRPIESAADSKSEVPGAFPETPSNEPATIGVNPVPASSGVGNPPPGDVNTNTVQSTVTTSKEDYEKAGTTAAAPEAETVSVQPIPASSSIGNPPSGDVNTNTIDSTATTSKEDYDKAGSAALPIAGAATAAAGVGAIAAGTISKDDDKKSMIPESSLPMGDQADKTLDAGPTIQSAGPRSTTAGLAAGVPLEQKRQAMVIDPDDAPTGEPAPSVPEPVKESIEQSHQSPEAAASPEAVKEKEAMEKELLNKVPSTDGAGEPAPTIAAATSTTAPAPTEASPGAGQKTPGQATTAAAAIADGAGEEGAVEAPKQTSTTEKTEADNTEYAPPHSQGMAPGVSPGAAAALSDGTEDPTLAEEPAVKMMNQNDAEASTDKATEPAQAETPSTAPAAVAAKGTPSTAPADVAAKEPAKAETPAKATPATAPTSAASKPTEPPSATSTPTKEKKKKHRVSAFFKKIFD